MRVILGKEVREFIKDYEKSMIRLKYKDKETARLKRDELKEALKDLGNFSGYNTCQFGDLGQEFDGDTGEILNPYLRQSHWGPFSFSYVIDKKKGRIYMKKIMQSSYVKEEIAHTSNDELSEFHSWMKRLNEVKGARPTFWIEG